MNPTDPLTAGPGSARPAEDPEQVQLSERSPRGAWPELGLVAATLLLAVAGTVGLGLALIDQFRTSVTLLVSIPVTVVLSAVMWRGARPSRLDTHARLGWAAACVVAVGFVVFAASSPSQHLLLDRDPGSYASTARWLADHPGLSVDPVADGFEDVPAGDLEFGGGAAYEMPDGTVQFQFNHLAAVLMAIVFDLFGADAMLLVPAMLASIGLLGVYAVCARATRRPLLSLLAPTALAVSLPLLFVARDTYSEPFVLALLWVGLLVALWNHRTPTWSAGLVAGILIGSLVSIRIDALLVVALAFPLMILSLLVVDSARRSPLLRSYCVMTATLGLVLAVGLLDLRTRTGRYEQDLVSQLNLLRLLTIASILVSAGLLVLWFAAPRLRSIVRPMGVRSAAICAAALITVFVAAWLIRPLVQVDRLAEPNSTIEAIQVRDGLPIDADRSYAEYSLWWMSWYLGPATLAAAIGGIGLGLYRMLRGTASPAVVLVWGLCLGAGAMYWWRPSNTPDHVWVMRRYVPAVLPCLVVLAVVAIAAAVQRWGGTGARRTTLTALATAAVLVPPLVVTWPVRDLSVQPGYIDEMVELCALIGDDAAVLVPAGYEQLALAQPLRSWCDVPVAVATRPMAAPDYAQMAESVAARDRQLWVVALDGEGLAAVDMGGGEVVSTGGATADRTAEPRLDGPPTGYLDEDETLPWFVPTPFALHARPVTP